MQVGHDSAGIEAPHNSRRAVVQNPLQQPSAAHAWMVSEKTAAKLAMAGCNPAITAHIRASPHDVASLQSLFLSRLLSCAYLGPCALRALHAYRTHFPVLSIFVFKQVLSPRSRFPATWSQRMSIFSAVILKSTA